MNGKNIFIAITLVLVLIFGGVLIKIVFFPINAYVQGVDMAYGVVNSTIDSEQAIRDYEWFKQQEADIRKCLANEQISEQAHKDFVAMLSENRADWSDADKKEERSLYNSFTACQKITNRAIEDYNAKSEMVNHAIFKDNLPTNISRAWYATSELIK